MNTLLLGRRQNASAENVGRSGETQEAEVRSLSWLSEMFYAFLIAVLVPAPILGLRYFAGINIFELALRFLEQVLWTAGNVP